MNACRDWNDCLLDSALGALEPLQARAVEAHVRTCAACAAALNQFRARAKQIDDALPQLVEEAQPPLGFHVRLLAAIEACSQPASQHTRRLHPMATAALLAALALAILLPAPSKRWPAGTQFAPASQTLSSWRSPTETLLRCSGDQLLRSTPRLGQFDFDVSAMQKNTGKKSGGKNDES
jgi:anti-sigma factor RsiW